MTVLSPRAGDAMKLDIAHHACLAGGYEQDGITHIGSSSTAGASGIEQSIVTTIAERQVARHRQSPPAPRNLALIGYLLPAFMDGLCWLTHPAHSASSRFSRLNRLHAPYTRQLERFHLFFVGSDVLNRVEVVEQRGAQSLRLLYLAAMGLGGKGHAFGNLGFGLSIHGYLARACFGGLRICQRFLGGDDILLRFQQR